MRVSEQEALVGVEPALAIGLRHALERNELRVHYFPIVGLADGAVVGVEALVRWERSGIVLDARQFLALAEKTGRIGSIGRWVLETACRDVAAWNRAHAGRPPLRLAVNLSLQQLTEPDAVEHIRSVLGEVGLDPTQLGLEIREDSLHELGVAVGPTLLALKDLGIRLSVDDFGTGASSLVALQRFQLDELKIDRSFVDRMDVDGDAAAIVRGVVRLADSLGLDTVAVGVERPAHERLLRDLGCHAAQGWRYGRPNADLDHVVARAGEVERTAVAEAPADLPGEDVGADHAALREANRRLEERASVLAEANDRLTAFASTLSHDLMQPVSSLSGFLSLLDRAVALDPEQRVWLEGAIRGKDRLAQAIDAHYRHAAAADLPIGPVDLAELVEQLHPGLVAELGDGRLEVGDLPTVAGDPGLITQVLANLVQNAGRYRDPARALVVHVSAHHEDGAWIVAVTDTGLGMRAEELELVFRPGSRGTSAAGTAGTGTGLATVRTLMRRMGGDAWAEDGRVQGARICLRFDTAD